MALVNLSDVGAVNTAVAVNTDKEGSAEATAKQAIDVSQQG